MERIRDVVRRTSRRPALHPLPVRHSVNGHGDTAQRMLRVQVDFDAMEAGGSYPSTLVTQVKDFCVMCHNPTVYAAGGDVAGSAFPNHAPGQNAHLNSNDLACMGCHAGTVDEGNFGGNGAARGNIHGGNPERRTPFHQVISRHIGRISGRRRRECTVASIDPQRYPGIVELDLKLPRRSRRQGIPVAGKRAAGKPFRGNTAKLGVRTKRPK